MKTSREIESHKVEVKSAPADGSRPKASAPKKKKARRTAPEADALLRKDFLVRLQHLRSVRRGWKRFRRSLREATGSLDADPVHDLRVSSRRLIAALSTLGDLIPEKPARKLRRALKKTLKLMSGLRDLHVQETWAERFLA